MTHYDIRIYGKVQGVFFRANTLRTALELGVGGWVRNEEDGSVSIAAEGPKKKLDELIKWCNHGPAYAHVEQVVYSEGPIQDMDGFKIIR